MNHHGRMRIGQIRVLSAGEVALAAKVFGGHARWRGVRIAQLPPLGFAAAVPFGRDIMFSSWRAPSDFARASLHEQGWLIHELAHVRQAARGTVLAIAKLSALGKRAYRLPGDLHAQLNIEQEAELARLVFLVRSGVKDGRAHEAEQAWALLNRSRAPA